MTMDDALITFLEESREMLEEMERLLLELEGGCNDREQLDALFRCVHTIKGSAGLFGLDDVVNFTHVVENVLDRLREGQITLDQDLSNLLISCRDHMAELVELLGESMGASAITEGQKLLGQLADYQGSDASKNSTATEIADCQVSVTREEPAASTDCWHISIRFGEDAFRNGFDPSGFIRYLKEIGEVSYISTIADAIPELDKFDPESCYLGFEIQLKTDADRQTIEDVFEFVREDCSLRIIPPFSAIREYIELINQLPEGEGRLGEILVACGALTATELAEGLKRQQDVSKGEKLGSVLVDSGVVHPEVVSAALDRQQQLRTSSAVGQYIRVQADRLDALINLVGELVIASAAAGTAAHRSGDSDTQEAVATVSALVEEIRDGSLAMRMVPIGETFQRFHRVVRDMAQELGKDIRLEISGADTELDKTVVEKIADPLTHLVRNALDHGIEAADLRRQRGKPVQGVVALNAFHEAGNIVVEVHDDGGGLNRERILEKALHKELIEPDQELSDSEVFRLIFEPGFSTASSVSNLSGRGVGMDVVKRNIESLRGTVDVESSEGIGTTFRIRLPLTLAIIDGFLVGVGSASYVIPLENIIECVELNAEQREETRKRGFINLRGEVLPIIRLREHFKITAEAGRRENIVVVQYGNQKAGLIVDDLMGEYQTVIKPLGRLFSNLPGISGSTILGNGEVALILDVPSLIKLSPEGPRDGSTYTAA